MSRSDLRRGDVWWIAAPEIPRRPAVVLTRDGAIPFLSRLLVVTATTTIRDIPTEVRVGPEDGMPRASVFSLDNVERVAPAYFRQRITTLAEDRVAALCAALLVATGC